ncbi:MAG: hypothetical protein IK085_07530 [Clostridia bacterium]|nr:hypothetical protein [Clostridia bacterium]
MKHLSRKFLCIILAALLFAGSFTPAFADVYENQWNFGSLIYEGTGIRHSVVPGRSGASPDASGYSEKEFPEKFNSMDEGLINTPEAQAFGDCWAYSAISTLEASAAKQGFGEQHFSKSHLCWFTFTPQREGLVTQNIWDDGGNHMLAAFTLANLEGIANQSDYPNKTADDALKFSEADRFNRASGFIIDEAATLYDSDDAKQWIMHNGAAVLSYFEDRTYTENSQLGSYMIYNGFLDSFLHLPNHAITVIGWDDTIPAQAFSVCGKTPNHNGAWIVKNSWFGDARDIMYMSYDQPVSEFGGLTVRKDDVYRHYTHSERGTSGYLYGNYAEQADVFTAQADERISRISFMVDSFGQSEKIKVGIKIYRHLPNNYNSPLDGALAGSYSLTCTHDGMFSYEIKDFIGLTKGEKYSVTISFEEGDGHNIALQLEQDMGDAKYKSADGESYVRINKNAAFTDTNKDLSKVGGGSGIHNTFVQVYTKCNHKATENGGERICSLCGKNLGSICEKHSDEIYSRITRKPTVSRDGEISYFCADCAGVVRTENIPALGKAKATIVKNAGLYKADYSDILKLKAKAENLPDGYHLEWYVDGNKAVNGEELNVLCERDMDIVLRVADADGNILKDASGKEIGDTEKVRVDRGIFKLIVGWFRLLFGRSKTKVQ